MTMLSTEELAQLAGVSAATVRRYARSGDVPALNSPGGHRKFDQEASLAALGALRERIRAVPSQDDAPFSLADPPCTPPGPIITVPASVRILEHPCIEPPWLDAAVWEAHIAVLDADY